jgi:NTE family protein
MEVFLMKKIRPLLGFLVLATLFLSPAFAGNASGPDGGVVLVLSGGGTRGFAHVGVLQVLEEKGIPVAGIVGTSMGAIMGGLAACGYDGEQLQEIIEDLDLHELLRDRGKTEGTPAGESGLEWEKSLLRLELDRSWRITGPLGGLEGEQLLDRLSHLTARVSAYDFMDLPIPFAAVATDLETGEAAVLTSGNLASAMRASMSIPGLFEPWEYNGHLYVDGGLVANAPVGEAKRLFPGYPVVVVDVTGKGKSREDIRNVVDVIDQMITIMTKQNVKRQIDQADVIITPRVEREQMLSTRGWDEIISRGREAARRQLDVIRAAAASAPPVLKRPREEALIVKDIQIHGMSETSASMISEIYESWKGLPLDVHQVEELCRLLRSRENVRNAEYSLERQNENETVLHINVQKAPAREVIVSGYASNIDPYRRLYGDLLFRNVFSEGDLIDAGFGVGNNWELHARYLGETHEKRRRLGLFLYGAEEQRDTYRSGTHEWERYRAGAGEHFSWGSLRLYAGYMAEEIRAQETDRSHGPVLALSVDNMDDPVDPSEGFSLQGWAWYTNDDSLLARAEIRGVQPLGDRWKVVLNGGAIFGDDSKPWNAAYLGAQRELYSLVEHPLKGENALWAGLALRRVFTESWWGRIHMDIFASGGRIYRDGWSDAEEAWEAGMGFTLPGRVFDGRFFVTYDDRGDWTFGYVIGRPRYDMGDPVP